MDNQTPLNTFKTGGAETADEEPGTLAVGAKPHQTFGFRVKRSAEVSGKPSNAGGLATPVRGSLLGDSSLLKMLGHKFITVGGKAQTKDGIVVAAPHDAPSGTVLAAGHDVNTRPFAVKLAEKLAGKHIVVTELRTFVDINKEPEGVDSSLSSHPGQKSQRVADRLLKLYYQSQVFADLPLTVIEIHGHESGNHDIEISTGFTLNSRIPQDQALIDALKILQKELSIGLKTLNRNADQPVTLGIYPLDPAVKFTAKGTHTFNKIERMRELGRNSAGLHIELSKRLRSKDIEAGYLTDQIITLLAKAILAFIQDIKTPPVFERKDHLFQAFRSRQGRAYLLSDRPYKVQQASRELVGQEIVSFHKRDMKSLDLSDADSIVISADENLTDYAVLRVVSADNIQKSHVGLSKKLRDTLGVARGESVFIAKFKELTQSGMALGVVANVDERIPETHVEMGETFLEALTQDEGDHPLKVASSEGLSAMIKARVTPDLNDTPVLNVSPDVAEALNVTSGDLVCFHSSAWTGVMDDKWYV